MEPKIIFDVGTKPFDWQPITVSAGLFIGGCTAILSEKFKWGHTAVKNVGYFLILIAPLGASYVSMDVHFSRRDHIRALATGQYEVVQGPVENFRPMYFQGRKEESFTISGHTFRYSDNESTTCFNQPTAHGGPIQAAMLVRVRFTGQCILRIEALSVDPGNPGKPGDRRV